MRQAHYSSDNHLGFAWAQCLLSLFGDCSFVNRDLNILWAVCPKSWFLPYVGGPASVKPDPEILEREKKNLAFSGLDTQAPKHVWDLYIYIYTIMSHDVFN